MAYNNINTQQPQGFWDASITNTPPVYDDFPGLELNQENMSLFNNQQQQQFQPNYAANNFAVHGQQDFNSSQYTTNHLKYESDHSASNLFDSNVGVNFNSTSDESSPLGKQVLSPDGSATSAGLDEKIARKVKSKRQVLDEQDAILIARDDSELNEEELQMKRKAQNRAAQRAFRERKETKLKELEAKLLESEVERQKLVDELESIRKQNISISTENEILRSKPAAEHDFRGSTANKFTFPKTQTDFIEAMVHGTNHEIQPSNVNKVYDAPDQTGHKILAMGAVWDYLQIKMEEMDLDSDSVDVNEVMNKLKGHERCHGYGPAYPLELVKEVITEVFDL
ncbi:Fcr3 transcriptional regulator [Scheffersomyces xylosifermentans]|uniref:Fcr3 transcriptional regulator n=1 Tax=Scheffersomyces xylosifermentans TaxID=1304137 RepID=UPI00315D94D9